ncbi:Ubiquitin C-terminal hydrolase 22 [Gurleya vavrai]
MLINCPHNFPDTHPHTKENLINTLGKYTFYKTDQKYFYSCSTCPSSFILHVCLTCFDVFCFKNKHHVNHFNDTKHSFSYCLEKRMLYCFTCKKYVIAKGFSELKDFVFLDKDEIKNNLNTDKKELKKDFKKLKSNNEVKENIFESEKLDKKELKNDFKKLKSNNEVKENISKSEKLVKNSETKENAQSEDKNVNSENNESVDSINDKEINYCDQKKNLNQNKYFLDSLLNLKIKINEEKQFFKLNNPSSSDCKKSKDKNFKKLPCNVFKGASNLGNSCYVSALLQVLLSINELKYYILTNKHVENKCENLCLICTFNESIVDLYSKSPALVFNNFIYYLCSKNESFLGSIQFDVHELFLKLCEYSHEEFGNEICEYKKCLFHKLFFGVNKIIMKCKECGFKNIKKDLFFNLSLDLSENSVQKMIENYYKIDCIEEKVFCEKCLEETSFIKKFKMHEFPNYLVICIKRFVFEGTHSIKLNEMIYSNPEICINKVNYKLHGYITHVGNTNEGHYFSTIIDGRTYKLIDDNKISDIDEKIALNNQAYLLFYKKMLNCHELLM